MSSSTPAGFAGLRVAAFESRLAGPMADLIAKHGGVPVEAPALREVVLGDNAAIGAFAEGLLGGAFDLVLFETGVGVRYLAQAIETCIPRAAWIEALARTTVVARGPKPTAALRELGARLDLQVPEPNTWRETLAALDARFPLAGRRIALQEYGQPIPELIAGLEQRGAIVTRVPVYRWALPEETGPLRRAIAEIAAGRIGAALFTSAQQVVHLLQIAAEQGSEADLRRALESRVVVGAIGPSTAQMLRANALPVDLEPEHPKMGHLVAAVAAGWRAAAEAKSARPHTNRADPLPVESGCGLGPDGESGSSPRSVRP
jgi:uroporphyrinogen-III synthase